MPFSWDAFLARYGPMARLLARPLVRPPATPEDVVQEAALALHRVLQREPARFPDTADARNYFLRAVRNQALRSRRGAREGPLEVELAGADPHDPAVRTLRERQAALGRLLVELDPAQREHVARRFLEGHTLARLAAESGIPISTLHDREKALLARLRRRLETLTATDQELTG
jgi:RNA polymerase sigma factor (sigma-70 family)